MKSAFDVLAAIADAKGKDKLRILAANKGNRDLQILLDATFNFNRRYYIRKFEFAPTSAKGVSGTAVAEFDAMLQGLEGGLRGKEAATLVHSFLSVCTTRQAEWYARVLRRDLKIGIGIDTVLEAGFDIPHFEVQLAKDLNKCKRLDAYFHEATIAFASTKLDGYRCFSVIQDGDVMMLTRNGNIFQNFPDIESGLREAFPKGNWCFDGEIISDDFSAMQQSAFATDRGTTVGDVRYNMFDQVSFHEWKSKKYTTPAGARYGDLQSSFKSLAKNPRFSLVEHFEVRSMKEFMAFYEKCLAQGFEGAMLNPDIPYYEGKVSNRMLKLKPNEDMEAEIIGVYEGEEGTRLEGNLGGFIILQENKVKGRVGTGIKDDDRAAIWKSPKSVIGRIIKVKYQEITKDGQLRFPRVVEFRFDKEKI